MGRVLKLADWQQQEEEARAEQDRKVAQLEQQVEVMTTFITKTSEFHQWLLMRDQWRRNGVKRTELDMVMQFLADQEI